MSHRLLPSMREIDVAPELAVIAGLPFQLEIARRALCARYDNLYDCDPPISREERMAERMVILLRELVALADEYVVQTVNKLEG